MTELLRLARGPERLAVPGRVAYDPVLSKIIHEVIQCVSSAEQVVVLVQFTHPIQCLFHITTGMGQQFQEQGQQPLERRSVVPGRDIARESETRHAPKLPPTRTRPMTAADRGPKGPRSYCFTKVVTDLAPAGSRTTTW